jgi:hypothetical protein
MRVNNCAGNGERAPRLLRRERRHQCRHRMPRGAQGRDRRSTVGIKHARVERRARRLSENHC